MALNDTNRILYSIKKLLGKAHTKQAFGVANESSASFVQAGAQTTFGKKVPPTPDYSNTDLYTIKNTAGVSQSVYYKYTSL